MFTRITIKQAPPFVAGVIRVGGPKGRLIQLFPHTSISEETAVASMSSFAFPGFPQPLNTVSPNGIALLIAGVSLAAGDVVVTTDGLSAILCDTAIELHGGKVYGVVEKPVPAGQPVRINTSSVVENELWNWVGGEDLYAGPAGLLTSIPDSGVPLFMQRVGYALDATRVKVAISSPIYL